MKNKILNFFFIYLFFLICCLIFFTNPLVFQIWSQMFQILTIKPLELFDTAVKKHWLCNACLAGFWPSKPTVWLKFGPKLGSNIRF